MSDSEELPVRKSTWSKARINFWLDVLLALVFIAVLTITSLLSFVFPIPTSAAGWWLWGWDYNDYARLQFLLICVLGAGIVLHVMLHWSWICGMLTRGHSTSRLRSDTGAQTLLGVIVLAAALHLIGLAVLVGSLMVVKP